MAFENFIPFARKRKEEIKDANEMLLRNYLENDSPVKYNAHALESTVIDVMALDEDLKGYVMHFLKNRTEATDIGCECVSIEQLLQTRFFTPVTAALFIQWYRRDPLNAARYLLQRDVIQDIPQELPECEE